MARRLVALLLLVPLLALPSPVAAGGTPSANPADPARLVGGELLVDQFDAGDFDAAFPGSLADQGPLALGQTLLGHESLIAGPNGFGSALEVAGANYARIDAPAPLAALSGDFTFMAWLKPHPFCGSYPVFTMQDQNGVVPFEVYLNCGQPVLSYVGGDGGGRGVSFGVGIPNDAWTHVAFVGTGDRVSLLVNGQTVATTTRYPTIYTASPLGNAYVGAAAFCCFSSGAFQGALDEVRLYNRALTNAEVADVSTLPYQHPNLPPVADAGPAQTVACSGRATSVTLDGRGSSDPNGDALAYSWSAPDATSLSGADQAVATAAFPVGVHAATLTVGDGELSSSAATTVTVVDGSPPALSHLVPSAAGLYAGSASAPAGRDVVVLGSVDVSVDAEDLCGHVASVTFTVDDGTSVTQTAAPFGFTYAPAGVGVQYRTLTVTAVDDAGNVAPALVVPMTVVALAPHAPSS